MDKIVTVKENLFELGTLFSIFENQKDKFIQLMDMAKDLEPLSDDEKNEENKIYGCTSQAWVVVKKNKDNSYSLKTDSDALIVKGLLFILQKIFNNQSASEIHSVNTQEILESIGLDGAITTQRTNGFSNALEKIQSIVE
tara:strand:+ start:3505 stop:3924 length:420 start_codon:yes stop_codon:yes gene_type:complete